MGTLSEIGTGSNNREDCSENGMYPFYVRSKEILRIDKYLYDEEAILIPGEGGVGEIFHYINGKYGLHQRTYRVHPTSKDVIGRYLYYYLYENFGNYINQKSYKSTATSIRKPMLLNFPVAVIPISEQNRIVGILDTFTSSIENLKEQIAQRRKQYEYYRDQLLDL
jgi:type I restriction enzyme S subunit